MDAQVYFPPTVLVLLPSVNISLERLKVRVEKQEGL
jgi:hypothetical protein